MKRQDQLDFQLEAEPPSQAQTGSADSLNLESYKSENKCLSFYAPELGVVYYTAIADSYSMFRQRENRSDYSEEGSHLPYSYANMDEIARSLIRQSSTRKVLAWMLF